MSNSVRIGEAKAVGSKCADAGAPEPCTLFGAEEEEGGYCGAEDESKFDNPRSILEGLPVPEDWVDTELLEGGPEASESIRVATGRDRLWLLNCGETEDISMTILSDACARGRSSDQQEAEPPRACRPFIRRGVA